MQKDFDTWNNLKKVINESETGYFPKEGEVWMSALGKNIGYEQNGAESDFSRPVLVITKFNNQMFWCTPLSTKQKKFDFYYNFIDPNSLPVSAIIAQLRLLSVKRLKRNLYTLPESDLLNSKRRIRSLL